MWSNWILKDIDLIIIDECHRQDFNYIFSVPGISDKKVIGVTATPQRSGKMRQLGLDYESIITTVSVQQLINRGYLVSDDYFGLTGADLNKIKIDKMKGDFSESDMFSRFNSPKLYAGVVDNWEQHARNSKTLIFCVNIEHVIHTTEEFQKRGYDARFVVSKMSNPKAPKEGATDGAWVRYEEKMRLYNLYLESFGIWSGERRDIIRKFERNEFPILINAGILTTGYDCPSIETIIVNRATLSVTLWFQMIGRGSRTFPGKTHFNLLDFGDNANRLGHYTSQQLWHLWHDDSSSGEGVAPTKFCGEKHKPDKNNNQGCSRLIHASFNICPFCGFIYPKEQPKPIELKTIVYNKKNQKSGYY